MSSYITTEEALALAVLKGDMMAALALADLVQETFGEGVPINTQKTKLKLDKIVGKKYKAIMYSDQPENRALMYDSAIYLRELLTNPDMHVVQVAGISKVEIFEVEE